MRACWIIAPEPDTTLGTSCAAFNRQLSTGPNRQDPAIACVRACCAFCYAAMQTAELSVKQLRTQATALGMDISWCLERSELVEVYRRAKTVRECVTLLCCVLCPWKHCLCGMC